MYPVVLVWVTWVISFHGINSWSGNVGVKKVRHAYLISYCSKRCWWSWSCCRTSYAWRYYYTLENYCLPGYRHNGDYNCVIPICSPRCRNGGTCVSPNTCACPDGYNGDICSGVAKCSHLHPCYPGRCYGYNQCMCSDGFSGNTCLRLTDPDFKPSIDQSNATFAKFSYTKNQNEYEYTLDATGKKDGDYLWSNHKEFNQMMFDVDAFINADETFHGIPAKPNYIRHARLGIVEAKVLTKHIKLGSGGEYAVHSDEFICPGLSSSKPIDNSIMKCRVKNATNVYQIDSGDRYQVKVDVTTGGFRELINTNNGLLYRTETYRGITAQNVMELRFDFDVPYHCVDFNNCSADQYPLKLDKDITKEAIKPRWKGWWDPLSGIQKYVFEVWKMEYSHDYDGLREPDILPDYNPVPEYIKEEFTNSTIDFPEYEPKEPAVYSIILEVADQANNTRYARRISIFDKTSEISLQSASPIIITSASNDSDYEWQTSNTSPSGTKIDLSWKNHFINTVHHRGNFLSKILDYTPRLSDENAKRIDYKKIDPGLDDNDGDRTTKGIPNVNGIVKFQTVHGYPSTVEPFNGWINTVLAENQSIWLPGIQFRDGDAYQMWVRAEDIMGNTKTDSVVVNFDRSPPSWISSKFEQNINDGPFTFASRVTVDAGDAQSGLKKIVFKFIVNHTGEVKNEKEFLVTPKTEDYCIFNPLKCYCTNAHNKKCFDKKLVFDVNNCWLKVPMDRIADDVYLLEISVYNLAMLSIQRSEVIGKAGKFNGIQKYYSPSNITVLKTTDNSLSITWIQAPTCYERAGILIRLFHPDNTTKDYKVHKDATQFDLTGLSETTHYWFHLYTKYGNDTHFVMSSSPAFLKFQTAEAPRGFPPGGVAGLVVGFIVILVIVVIVLVFLGRTGRLKPAKARVTQGIRTIRNTIRVRNNYQTGSNNRARYSKYDDDIYYYGQMELKAENTTAISRKDISLETELKQGRFAVIYLAKFYGNKLEEQTVVAKVVKDDQNQDNIMKMKAKINFYAEKVGHHKNVMDFIGAVEDDIRGPMMILEYCPMGVLKDFLLESKTNLTVDTEERLFRMNFGICMGMDYLASKKVVHRRLAARNILLSAMLEPKIAGFGPDPSGDDSHNDDEKVPLKWMAPECMRTTKNANELSDVWSYGIVMWEIFSLGETPYPGIQSRDVPSKVKQGYKMKKPENCDDSFYKIMLQCWHYDPKKRAGFAEIKEQLNAMFTEAPGDEYYYRTNDL